MRKAELKSAYVDIQNKSAMGCYTTEGGQNIIVSNPLTDAEMEASARHPETFFGILEPGAGQNIKDPLELFAWMYRSYRTTPREKLLEFMRSHSDATELQQKSQAELAIIYCERCVESMLLGQ